MLFRDTASRFLTFLLGDGCNASRTGLLMRLEHVTQVNNLIGCLLDSYLLLLLLLRDDDERALAARTPRAPDARSVLEDVGLERGPSRARDQVRGVHRRGGHRIGGERRKLLLFFCSKRIGKKEVLKMRL